MLAGDPVVLPDGQHGWVVHQNRITGWTTVRVGDRVVGCDEQELRGGTDEDLPARRPVRLG